jgi:hypothetical protein
MPNLCDKCGVNPAGYRVSGLTPLALFEGLCGKCCADYLVRQGDLVGAFKFIGRGEL